MINVAVLLTGLDDNFSKIEKRLLEQFSHPDIVFDFYGHSWAERIPENNSIDSIETFRNQMVLKFTPETENVIYSSYNEILDVYLNTTSDFVRLYNPITYLAYMTQTVSTNKAFYNAEKLNGKKYDVVIKWRWDLLCDTDVLNFSNLITLEKGKLHTHHLNFTDGTMNDYYYYADLETFRKFVRLLPILMSYFVCDELSYNKGLIHERMLFDCAKLILGEDNIVADGQSVFGVDVAIYRPTADPHGTFEHILKTGQNNRYSWISRISKE